MTGGFVGVRGPRRRARVTTGALAELGAVVTERRLGLGLTQQDLADLAGVGLSSVRTLEGGRETMTLAVALRICDALGLALAVGPRPALQAIPGTATLRVS
jgi:y4mF family transcriptional regulator